MEIKSEAFGQDEPIPPEYTCDGSNMSPGLEISEIPREAKTMALIVDDPDAPGGTFVHWLVWNVPVAESVKIAGGQQVGISGTNGFGNIGYGGPCPPSGEHNYFFKVYALSQELNLGEGAGKQQLLDAMEGHIVGQAELVGTYSRN
ncbi:YbhB/YbcL family Raf kinase inhibitor-like protein [Candidatus Pacearchaeota archaeon]|nr:YbhB/YbcL family Raf kinase inhibitor-like protein [Candidatus Pacearchaeota archaeon]